MSDIALIESVHSNVEEIDKLLLDQGIEIFSMEFEFVALCSDMGEVD
ncbi:MAG: hypothetical protein AABY49_07620 [Planctomycetota bacterium]